MGELVARRCDNRKSRVTPRGGFVWRKKLVKAKQIEPMVPVGPPDLESGEVALVLVHDDFAPDSLVEIAIGVWPGSDVGKWRVDECSIQRVE